MVIMSGNADVNAIDAAIQIGATDYLIKPIPSTDLLTRVNCLTQIYKMKRERDRLQEEYKRMSAVSSFSLRKV